ncbi:hypothetical protein pb186bvf_000118 [Paramecium bursaria]
MIQEVDQQNEHILKWAQNLFKTQGQLQRFKTGKFNMLIRELNEILLESKNQRYHVEFGQNNQTKRWVEIEIGIRQKVEIYDGNETIEINKIILALQIGKDYPIKDVRVVCKTTFVTPSLADGRNLLPDIQLQHWSYKNQLVNIIKLMPQFIEKVLQYRSDKIFLQNIGQYYLGGTYTIDELKEYPDLERYPVIQQQNAFLQNTLSIRLICLSEAHFYIFEYIENSFDLRLIFRAPLQSCTQLKKSKKNNDEITLIWRNYQNKQEENQLFTMKQYDEFIKSFLKRINYYQHIRISTNSYMHFGQKEGSRIQSIMSNLNILETEIEKKFNQQNINKLMDLYQQAIEFFSSNNDYLYQIYLYKLQTLIQRQDVQVISQFK